MVEGRAPLLRDYGYTVDGDDFSVIDATVRTDNRASKSILSSVGIFGHIVSEKFGAQRFHKHKDVPLPDARSSWQITADGSEFIVKEKLQME
jgi:hypothetical protein